MVVIRAIPWVLEACQKLCCWMLLGGHWARYLDRVDNYWFRPHGFRLTKFIKIDEQWLKRLIL